MSGFRRWSRSEDGRAFWATFVYLLIVSEIGFVVLPLLVCWLSHG